MAEQRKRSGNETKTKIRITKNILCVDLGTKTGWALTHSIGVVSSGTQNFTPGRFDGGGMRYLRFITWLDEILVAIEKIDELYFEEVRRHIATDAAHVYGGFMAHLTAWCEKNKIPYSGVPVQTIKKHATGKGNAKKEMMIEAAISKGYDPVDDNEADALALLHWAMEK